MATMARWLLGLLLVTATWTGCLGVSDDEPVEATGPTTAPPASEDEGAIAGTVTDTAIEPVAGATVAIPSLSVSTQTSEDGGFRLDEIPPGSHQVTVRAPGFLPAQETVEAEAGETATVEFVLAHLQEDKPFQQTFELKGFMEYGWAVGANLTGDAVWVRDTTATTTGSRARTAAGTSSWSRRWTRSSSRWRGRRRTRSATRCTR